MDDEKVVNLEIAKVAHSVVHWADQWDDSRAETKVVMMDASLVVH